MSSAFKVLKIVLFWLHILLAVWQILKMSPIGVFVKSILWGISNFKSPYVKDGLIVLGPPNSVTDFSNQQDFSDYDHGFGVSIKYKYFYLGHLAIVSNGGVTKTFHFEEPYLYTIFITAMKTGNRWALDGGQLVHGISKYYVLDVFDLAKEMLNNSRNFIKSENPGFMLKQEERGSDYFMQGLSLFNVVYQVPKITAATTFIYILLDRWHWLHDLAFKMVDKIMVDLVRIAISTMARDDLRIKIYNSLRPYWIGLAPSNFLTMSAETKEGEFLFLPNSQLDSCTFSSSIDQRNVQGDASGTFKKFSYSVQRNDRETIVRFMNGGVIVMERTYRWTSQKSNYLKIMLQKSCELGVGPIEKVCGKTAYVVDMGKLLDHVENKKAWFYVGIAKFEKMKLC